MKVPKMRSMSQIGHYRPPRLGLPGQFNKPRHGRVGKMLPSIKQFTPLPKPKGR